MYECMYLCVYVRQLGDLSLTGTQSFTQLPRAPFSKVLRSTRSVAPNHTPVPPAVADESPVSEQRAAQSSFDLTSDPTTALGVQSLMHPSASVPVFSLAPVPVPAPASTPTAAQPTAPTRGRASYMHQTYASGQSVLTSQSKMTRAHIGTLGSSPFPAFPAGATTKSTVLRGRPLSSVPALTTAPSVPLFPLAPTQQTSVSNADGAKGMPVPRPAPTAAAIPAAAVSRATRPVSATPSRPSLLNEWGTSSLTDWVLQSSMLASRLPPSTLSAAASPRHTTNTATSRPTSAVPSRLSSAAPNRPKSATPKRPTSAQLKATWEHQSIAQDLYPATSFSPRESPPHFSPIGQTSGHHRNGIDAIRAVLRAHHIDLPNISTFESRAVDPAFKSDAVALQVALSEALEAVAQSTLHDVQVRRTSV
jgi:hypothetical protein